MTPLINILIRTSFRPTTFARSIKSIQDQTYRNYKVIVSYDDERALEYIPAWCESLPVVKQTQPFGYNLYCNDLKAQVKDGWVFFLDDDDKLLDSDVLQNLAYIIENNKHRHSVFICQFIRGMVVKPIGQEIVKGKIGMPCIVLEWIYAGMFDFCAEDDADYQFIRDICIHLTPKFTNLITVRASRRGWGYVE